MWNYHISCYDMECLNTIPHHRTDLLHSVVSGGPFSSENDPWSAILGVTVQLAALLRQEKKTWLKMNRMTHKGSVLLASNLNLAAPITITGTFKVHPPSREMACLHNTQPRLQPDS